MYGITAACAAYQEKVASDGGIRNLLQNYPEFVEVKSLNGGVCIKMCCRRLYLDFCKLHESSPLQFRAWCALLQQLQANHVHC